MRAVVRDLKNYISKHSQRQIPVGYSAADVRDVLQDTWAYLQCALNGDDNDMSRSDFFGLNSYSWCGNSNFQTSQYDQLVTIFANTTVPVFFSEYGCNDPTPRLFDEVLALYGPQMTVMSGGLVYEWTQETSNYGLVQVYSNNSAQLLQDYNTLQSQYNKLNVTLLESANSTATALTPPACGASLISGDGFPTNFTIPSPPSGANAVISSGISNAPTGSIVPVTQTSVAVPVYDVNGAAINNLAIAATSGSNTPSGQNTGGSASAGGSSRASSARSSSTRTQSGTATGSAAAATSSGAANVFSGAGANGALALVLGAGLYAL